MDVPEKAIAMNDPIRCRRLRWFQISLRSLFVTTLIAAAYFAGYTTARRESERLLRDERESAARLARREKEAVVDQILLENRLLAIELDRKSPTWRKDFDLPVSPTRRARLNQ